MTATVSERFQIASAFQVLNREHINDATFISMSIGWASSVSFHLDNTGNAAQALSFALAQLSDPEPKLSGGDDTVHVHVSGTYAGVRIELVTIARNADAARLKALDGWAGKMLALTVNAFCELAATDPA
jgi:hypothetical protein